MPEIAAACVEGCVAGAAFTAGAFVPAFADSTSALTMRPRGPEPFSAERSTPFCAAILRARGDANIRPADFIEVVAPSPRPPFAVALGPPPGAREVFLFS